jgi:hypothetical protein
LYIVTWLYNLSTLHQKNLWLIIFLPLSIIIVLFPINYCINNIVNIFYPASYRKGNYTYYRSLYNINDLHPDLTIQIPVYKEDFYKTIVPTLETAILARSNYRGKCNIIVLDDGYEFQESDIRMVKDAYYSYFGITCIARPVALRRGKFKKASNLNNHLKLAMTDSAYYIGKYILLIDSDSRIDYLKINEIVSTIDSDPSIAYIQFHTKPLDNSYGNFFSRQIAQFTKNLYNIVFVLVTIGGEPAPLVGHNAIIRTSVLYKLATDLHVYWSEDKVSEDFDFSFRSQIDGYKGIYATFATFQEGISFDLYSEVLKMSKFTHGSIEILLSRTYRKYLLSRNVPWMAKLNISSYLFSYLSLALTPILGLNQVILGYYIEDFYKITADPVMLMITSVSIFTILGPVATTIYLTRSGIQTCFSVQLKMGLFMFLFYSGSLFWFLGGLIGIRTWGATKKEQGKIAISSFKYHYYGTFVYMLCLILILIFCPNWYGSIPIWVIIIGHLVIPLLWRGSTEVITCTSTLV